MKCVICLLQMDDSVVGWKGYDGGTIAKKVMNETKDSDDWKKDKG